MKHLARRLRRNQTAAEKLLWSRVRNRQLEGWKFRRQEVIGKYIVDFVCLEKGLIVELDGGQHAQQATKDASRSADLNKLGYRVMRFWNNEVLNETEAVVESIRKALIELPSPQPSPGGRGSERQRMVL